MPAPATNSKNKAAPTVTSSVQLPSSSGKLFYTRDKDRGFTVLRWGSLDDDDSIARRDAPGEVDLVPAGFMSQRILSNQRSFHHLRALLPPHPSLSNTEPGENVSVQFQPACV